MATVTIPKIYANFETSLAAKISDAASSFTLARSTDPDGTTLSGTYILTFDEGKTTEEHAIVTLSGASGTFVTRGLSKVTGNSEVSANKHEHDLGSPVKITNFPLVTISRLLNGTDTFNSVDWLGVNSISGLATPTSGELTKAANVEYVNEVALAGAPDAASNAKGVAELATAAEAAAGTASGSAGPLVIPASLCNATSSAAQIIPVTESDGDLNIGFMPLDQAWAFTSTVNIATASNWQLGGTAFTGSMALLNEACTVFNATDVSGAELETLSNGSNADALHVHGYNELLGVINDVSNDSTNETTLFTATIPANTLGTGNAIVGRCSLNGRHAAGNWVIKLKYGATTIATITESRANLSTNTGRGFLEFILTADGATGAQNGAIGFYVQETNGGVVNINQNTGTAIEDSTGALSLTVTIQCTDTTNTEMVCTSGAVWIMRT